MTVATLHGQTGLYVSYFEPPAIGGNWLGDFVDRYESYSHEILADGGYWTAQITVRDLLSNLEDWFEEGLGRDVVVMDERDEEVWRGIVNLVTINAGGASESRGPLFDIGNRVSAVYAPVDYTEYPPVVGATTVTTIAENAASQARYGIVEKVIQAGTAPDDDAEQARDTYLNEFGWPATTGSLAIAPGSGNAAVMTLNCVGHVKWLENYVYNDDTAGASRIDVKIPAVLAADPNGFLSTDYSKIAANAYLVPTTEMENKMAMTVIKSAVAIGDVNDNRYLFGVYAGRRAEYRQIPGAVTYEHRLSDPRQRVVKLSGEAVRPWKVLPGYWIFVSDFLVGRTPISGFTPELRQDPRNKFLESVRYTAPFGLDLSGGRSDRLSQLLAKLGVGAF